MVPSIAMYRETERLSNFSQMASSWQSRQEHGLAELIDLSFWTDLSPSLWLIALQVLYLRVGEPR